MKSEIRGGEERRVKRVVVRKENDENPILNSVIYEVEFPDGQLKEYAANVIAENMLAQVDHEGYSTTLIQGIVD